MSRTARNFTTIALVGNDQDARVVESVLSLAAHLRARGRRVCTEASAHFEGGGETLERMPEAVLIREAHLVVAVGGDGTMLHAARLAGPHGVPVLGVTRGRLGVLADIGPAEMRDRLDDILAGRYVEDQRAMLKASLVSPGRPGCHAPAPTER